MKQMLLTYLAGVPENKSDSSGRKWYRYSRAEQKCGHVTQLFIKKHSQAGEGIAYMTVVVGLLSQ